MQNLEALVISPGPGYPDSGDFKEAIKTFGKEPSLGIRLGDIEYSIEVYGEKVVPAKRIDAWKNE